LRNTSYELWPAAEGAQPPFAATPVMSRWVSFWRVLAGDGRAIGEAKTRAGARAAVRALYDARGLGL
jgi:hypothetical protein